MVRVYRQALTAYLQEGRDYQFRTIWKQELEKLGLDPKKDKFLKKSNLTKEGQPERWDSVNLDVFKPFLDKCLNKGLPILNANPDASAPEKERGMDPVIINDVVING